MVAAWGEILYESSDDDDEDELALISIGESDKETELIDESEDNEKEQMSKECVIVTVKCKNLKLRVHALDSTILEPKSENLKLKLETGKKTVDHTQLTLEENIGKMKYELYKRDKQVRILKEDLIKVKHELDRICKWNRSSNALSWLQEHYSCNRRGLGFGNPAPKWDPKIKYLTLPENKICTHCGNTGYYKSECTAKEKGIIQIWYMDSGCSKHMTRSKNQFLSLEDLKGDNVFFAHGKKGEVIGVGKMD
ncbi:uncharacterized protein [Nicotiana tomentosiformis]|uniref:uncharacterized protein n=1 Tax=Nicotiana tomentosiformis TaxID=4098 RepID=UPI00388C83AC